ncbi:MAG: hypothetical protein IPQ08_00045 [Chitinophagaceae bacterium]|nr:hypothetical protein [Chitinophagaceae bacterium]
MNKQTTIILIVAGALLLVILMIIKNKRDRKKLFTGAEGEDPVEEQHTEQINQRDIS